MKRRIYIDGYDCSTSISSNKEELWNALRLQETGIKDLEISSWPRKVKEYWSTQEHSPRACKFKTQTESSIREELACRLELSYQNATANMIVEKTSRIGIIYSSTKGAIEDFIWEESLEEKLSNFCQDFSDPLEMVLETFIEKIKVKNISVKQCVSNACASTHAALNLGKLWLDNDLCDQVIVLAADYVGPFIQTGFKSLKALCAKDCRPFQDDRDGLILGEASVCVVLSHNESKYELKDVSIYNEAHAVTSPSPDGQGLFKCIDSVLKGEEFPELVFAHGTGTIANDFTEDRVLFNISEKYNEKFYVTASKWSVGHCLGASGGVDLILALSSLENNEAIGIKSNTPFQEKNKLDHYLYNEVKPLKLNNILINSLGFGGTNGAILVGRSNEG